MSGKETANVSLDDDALAFEYVAGSLQGLERDLFQQRLNEDSSLADRVLHWENHLAALLVSDNELAPQPGTWQSIEDKLKPRNTHQAAINSPTESTDSGSWFSRFGWALSGALASFVLTLTMWDLSPNSSLLPELTEPRVDYVAVMAGSAGTAVLTTLGDASSSTLTLSWSDTELSDDSDYQLWAVSRRDGETRSLAVVDNESIANLELSQAQWRLVVDAQTLLLTREEIGGSAIDEPSDQLIASGICVRLRNGEAKS
ncbi:MAG: anti-sigma factor [Halioglobus sp.]